MRRAVVALSLVAACGPTHGGGDDDDPSVDARVDARVIDGTPTDDGRVELPSRVYAHSGPSLYVVDTTTLVQTRIGDFIGLGNQSMLDIAVDRDERMIGITRDKIFQVDVATAATTLLATFGTATGFTSLSFVPADPGNPDGPEVLIAASDAGSVYRIDITGTTASAVLVGGYGMQGATPIGSSGDIVSVRGFGTVATVNLGAGGAGNGPDYLARLDPTMGWKATIIGGGTGFDQIFGLGFWGGTLYGFVDDGFEAATGAMIEIDPTTGSGTLIRRGDVRWFGAGVTTIAPVIP